MRRSIAPSAAVGPNVKWVIFPFWNRAPACPRRRLEPSAELRELERAILRHDPVLAASAQPSLPQLPVPPNRLIGGSGSSTS